MPPSSSAFEKVIDQDVWLSWWASAADNHARGESNPLHEPNPRPAVEAALIESLEIPALSGYAARKLGEIGGSRAVPALRAIVKNEAGENSDWSRLQAAWTLGMLLDEGAVECLELPPRPRHLSLFATVSLGQLGTDRSRERADRPITMGVDEKHIANGLIAHGAHRNAVAMPSICKYRANTGPFGLPLNRDRISLSARNDEKLLYSCLPFSAVPYLDAAHPGTDQERWALQGAIRRIDGDEIRQLLRGVGKRE